MRVNNVDAFVGDDAPQSPCGSRIELPWRTTIHDGQPRRARALGQRVIGPRGNDRSEPPAHQLGSEPEHLALATAPTALGIDVKDAKAHRAQHLSSRYQGEGTASRNRAAMVVDLYLDMKRSKSQFRDR